jgi:uncharacterized tellurite resistance protein B-like protein
MFSIVKKILTKKSTSSTSADETELRTHIAAGVLLLEAAHVDNECTEEEMKHVVQTLKTTFNLSVEYIDELIEKIHLERDNAADLWQFTNHMNQNYTQEEKLKVMEDVWRVIHADGQLEKHEDQFAHKLANLLRLTHKQMIDAKLNARN